MSKERITSENKINIKLSKPRSLYLIKRGPKWEFHNAPFHPIIICTRKHTAKWEVGDSNKKSTLWCKDVDPHSGWTLSRYKGFDIDYGGLVKRVELFDGTYTEGYHDKDKEPWTLLKDAVWWSDQEIPKWLREIGVDYPEDDFSRRVIYDDLGDCLLSESEADKLQKSRDKYDFEILNRTL